MRSPRVAVACSAALFVPLLIPLLTGQVFTHDDLGAYHIPLRYAYSQALHRGDSILWTPAVYAGYYLFGEGQLGMAHPWHLLLYRVLPLAVAFNIEIVSSYVAMFAGVVVLLKRLGLSREARWFGAMVFTFSGYNLFHLIHVNIVAVVAHIPWILAAAHAALTSQERKTRARAFVALALLFGSQLLLGHPQHVWFGLVALGCLCLYFIWTNGPLGGVALIAGAAGAGVLIGGVQLLPLLDVVSASQRVEWSPYFSLTFSLLPINVIQLWSPFFFENGARAISIEDQALHEFIVYNGAFCTVALAWLAVRWRALRRRRLVAALLVLAVLALLLAFGRYGGLYATLVGLPGLRWFRAPSRHLLLFQLSLSVIAAIVFDDLASLAERRERIDLRRLWPLAVPSLLSILTVIIGATMVTEPGVSAFSRTAPWALVFVAVSALFGATARGARWAIPLLIVVTACDQGYWGFQYVFGPGGQRVMTIDQLAARAALPLEAQPGDLVETELGYQRQNAAILKGLRTWPGYVGLPPELTLPARHPDFLTERLAGVRWLVTEDVGSEVIQDAASRARLVTAVKVSANAALEVDAIHIATEAVVDRPIGPLWSPPGSVRILEDRPGRIVIETDTPGRQLLALTERFDAGWRVRQQPVDDKTAGTSVAERPLRINGDFLGIVVKPGAQRVTFQFAPKSFIRGLWISALGLFIVLCTVLTSA